MLRASKFRFVTYFFMAAALLLAAIFLASEAQPKDAAAVAAPSQPQPLCLEGEYSVDGGPWKDLGANAGFGAEGRQTVIVRGHFTQDIPAGEDLLFYARDVYVTLKIDGVQAYAFGDPEEKAAFATPGTTLASVPLAGVTTKSQVEFTLTNAFPGSAPGIAGLLNSLAAGHSACYYQSLWLRDGPILLFSASVALLGLCALALALVSKLLGMAGSFRAAAVGLFAIAAGAWAFVFANPYTLPLLTPSPKLTSGLRLLCLFLLPASALPLAYAYTAGPYKRACAVLQAALCAACGALLLLQVLGYAQLYEARVLFTLFPLLCLGGLALLALDAWRQKKPEARLVSLFLLPALLCAALGAAHFFRAFTPQYALPAACLASALGLLLTLAACQMKRGSDTAAQNRALEKRVRDSQAAIMISQVQPRFLFNALVAIQRLCNKDPEQASLAIAGFAHYLRGNLDSLSGIDLIPLERELDHVKAYLALEKTRSPELDVQYYIQATAFLLPPLTLQPLVENAVCHGIAKNEAVDGTIIISTWQTETHWLLSVQDNGRGFVPAQMAEDGLNHVGIENVRGRLEALCGGTLELITAPGEGTTAQITIPKHRGGQR